MKLSGLHILLTYQCTFECDHCFVWGSPWQSGTLTIDQIRQILHQAKDTQTIEWIYFEGGEPFLYYVPLLQGVQLAADMGFQVGLVTNSYWANSQEDALEWLKPFKGLLQDLSVSSDLFHYDEMLSRQASYASQAAEKLGIPVGVISIAQPEEADAPSVIGQLPLGDSKVMFRGRAAEKLISLASSHPWETFTECPEEDLKEPGRVHLDPFGNLHICQGISMGNLFQKPLAEICQIFNPNEHPVIGPLLSGGPAELVRKYDLPHVEQYADACHLCYIARKMLRSSLSEILMPDQMYGVAIN